MGTVLLTAASGNTDLVVQKPFIIVPFIIASGCTAEAYPIRPYAHSGNGVGPAAQLIQFAFAGGKIDIVQKQLCQDVIINGLCHRYSFPVPGHNVVRLTFNKIV